jgi:hypothetical protein
MNFLRSHGLFYTSIDAPEDNSIVPSFIDATFDQVYVRVHGKNRENWFKRNITAAERFKYLFGTGAPVACQRFRQSGATGRQARVCDLQQLLSEFWNHERNYNGGDPSGPGALARGGESARTILKAPCKRNGSTRRTYAMPSSREAARPELRDRS